MDLQSLKIELPANTQIVLAHGLTDEEIIASLNHIEEGQTHTISDIKEAVLSGSSIIKK